MLTSHHALGVTVIIISRKGAQHQAHIKYVQNVPGTDIGLMNVRVSQKNVLTAVKIIKPQHLNAQ